jgi:hypothetical protein
MVNVNARTTQAEATQKSLQPANPAEMERIDGGYPPLYTGVAAACGGDSYFQATGINDDCPYPGKGMTP